MAHGETSHKTREIAFLPVSGEATTDEAAQMVIWQAERLWPGDVLERAAEMILAARESAKRPTARDGQLAFRF